METRYEFCLQVVFSYTLESSIDLHTSDFGFFKWTNWMFFPCIDKNGKHTVITVCSCIRAFDATLNRHFSRNFIPAHHTYIQNSKHFITLCTIRMILKPMFQGKQKITALMCLTLCQHACLRLVKVPAKLINVNGLKTTKSCAK